MNTKKTITLAVLVCGLSSMLLFADNGFLQSAYALTISNIIISGTGSAQMSYSSPNNRYVMNNGGGVIYTVNPTAKTSASVTLPAVGGESYGTGASCSTSLTSCYIVSSGGGLPDRIRTYNPISGSIVSDTTVNTSGADINIAGISTVSTSERGNDGWFLAVCSAGGGVLFNIAGQVLGACGGTTAVQSGSSLLDVKQSGTNIALTTSSATNSFRIFSSTTGLIVCQVNINVGTGGTVEYYNSNFYVVVGTNTINKYSTSCGAGTGISNHGISSQIFGLLAIGEEGVFGVEGTTSIAYMNITSTNISTVAYSVATNFTETVTAIRGERLAYASGFNQTGLNIDVATANDPFLFVQYVPAGSSAGSDVVNGVDCALPANAHTLLCALHNQGGAGALTGASVLVDQSGTNIMCQVGLLECTRDASGNFVPTNPDTKTNGVGYILTIVAMGVFVGILWVASRGDLTSIPTFIWFIGTLAILGTATAFEWIDPTFLIIGVFAILGLAVAKARNVFGGQTLFAGEG